MCGIIGAVSVAPIDPRLVERMRDRLAHRGPDAAGLWLADDERACLGHRRLAIVDLSPDANQPFVSTDGRFVITFNGEIYNFKSIREELAAKGAAFRTRSDTEVLLKAFRHWGAECLSRLAGMFAFAIWDNRSKQLFCARDRVGEKPFYYIPSHDGFVFASELKALVEWPGFRRAVHYPALVDYLAFGFVADPKTIWEGCYKLPAGHWLCVQLGRDSVCAAPPMPYWDMEFDPDYSVTDWSPRILDTLQSASKEMAFADVPVGAFLSGGVDSSSVTAALSKAGCSVNTFTVGFEEDDYDERPWARQIATLYHTAHTEKVVTAEDVEPVFRKLLWHYDEPFNDYSYLPTFYLCREARKDITVALSGDGGDELFAGYLKYQRLGMRQTMESYVPPMMIKAAAGAAQWFFRESSPSRRKFLQYGLDSPDLLTDMFTTGLSVAALRAAARGPLAETLKHYTPADIVRPMLRKAPPEQVGLINSMRYLDLKLTLSGDILVKVDRASMAVSLEVRPVYVHRDLLALASRIPAENLADGSHSKEALKAALRSWLPDTVLRRRKMGFALPLKSWMKNDLRQFFSPDGTDSALSDLFDHAALERFTATHMDGRADMTAVLHSVSFLKHWFSRWT